MHSFNEWVRAKIAAAPMSTPVVIVGRYAGIAMGVNELRDASPPGYFSMPYDSTTPALLREFAANIVTTACEAATGGRSVYLVRPIPEMGVHVPKSASRRMSLGMNGEVSITMADYKKRNAWIWEAQDEAARRCGITVLDPSSVLCRDGSCYGLRNGRPVYFDDDHLSEYGNALLAPLFAPVFDAR